MVVGATAISDIRQRRFYSHGEAFRGSRNGEDLTDISQAINGTDYRSGSHAKGFFQAAFAGRGYDFLHRNASFFHGNAPLFGQNKDGLAGDAFQNSVR